MPLQSLLGLVFNPGKYLERYEVFLLGCCFKFLGETFEWLFLSFLCFPSLGPSAYSFHYTDSTLCKLMCSDCVPVISQ